MNLNEALSRLKKLPIPVVRTNDAAAIWETSPATASQMLGRLAKCGHVNRLQRGLWLLDTALPLLALHPFITDPSPSYLSLQTALFHYGMIEQIPTTIHVVSTAKPRSLTTEGGTYAIHRVAPAFFTGFEPLNGGPAQVATPEKALVDFCYFFPTKTRAFRSLPELDLPARFRKTRARGYISLIASKSRRAMVEKLLIELGSTQL